MTDLTEEFSRLSPRCQGGLPLDLLFLEVPAMRRRPPIRKIRELSLLERLFGSTSRERILTLLLEQPDMSFFQREIMFETGQSLQALQRELANLVDIGIVKRTEMAARVYYQIDDNSFLFKPLKEIFKNSAGR